LTSHHEPPPLPQGGPRPFVANDKSCHEVLVLTGSHAIAHDYSDYFVAGLASAIPRAVCCDKGITLILSRELSTIVEDHFQRCRMRLEQNVRNSYSVTQVGPLANMIGVLTAADVIPWPSEEIAAAYCRNEVRWEIIAETIALIR